MSGILYNIPMRAKILLFLFLLFSLAQPSLAADKVNIYFFWGQGCPHCAAERKFLDSLQEKYPQIEIKSFEVTKNRENAELLQKIGQKLDTDVSTVPFTIIGKYHFSGYLNDQTSGQQIEEATRCAIETGCGEEADRLIMSLMPEPQLTPRRLPETLHLPLFGPIKPKNFSLPALTFIIALLDGFNPCAMWVLIFLISLLLGMKDRPKMWLLGTTFIAVSAFVYFLFMSAWLNLFLFLGFVFWVRITIGLVALAAGGYHLRDYFLNQEAVCKVTDGEKRQKVFEKLKIITSKERLILAIIGIILLAFAVNLVELVCSAGLPAVYTQILSLTKLAKWQYYLYLLFYIFIFMLDDLFVFIIAMVTLQTIGITTKYARLSRLIGGLAIFIIGILLLFKPEALMFG